MGCTRAPLAFSRPTPRLVRCPISFVKPIFDLHEAYDSSVVFVDPISAHDGMTALASVTTPERAPARADPDAVFVQRGDRPGRAVVDVCYRCRNASVTN